jgi:glucan-binding YG repeat protein
MQNQLEKAINLSRKTGDRLIVFDSVRSENPFVVMNLDEYEKMMTGTSQVRGLTEDELLDKINRDIAIWKSDQTEESYINQRLDLKQNFAEDADISEEPIRTIIPEQPTPFQEESLRQDSEQAEQNSYEEEPKKSNHWAIRNEVKEGAEEIVEEEQQHLETITY